MGTLREHYKMLERRSTMNYFVFIKDRLFSLTKLCRSTVDVSCAASLDCSMRFPH